MVELEALFTAYEKINSGFGFGLRSFRMACSLIMHSFVWIWKIYVTLLNIDQLLENARWSNPHWQHLTLVLYLSLLCPLLLHLAQVSFVSRHLFTVCPYLSHVLQLIGLS